MYRPRCAAAVFGVAVAVGTAIGASFAFFIVLASLRSLPSATPDVASWIGSLGVSSIALIAGGIAGALTGAAAWCAAALVLTLVDLRPQALSVRASAVGIGSAVGAALALWFFASRPGVSVGVDVVVVLSALAATLAVGALLVPDRYTRRSNPSTGTK